MRLQGFTRAVASAWCPDQSASTRSWIATGAQSVAASANAASDTTASLSCAEPDADARNRRAIMKMEGRKRHRDAHGPLTGCRHMNNGVQEEAFDANYFPASKLTYRVMSTGMPPVSKPLVVIGAWSTRFLRRASCAGSCEQLTSAPKKIEQRFRFRNEICRNGFTRGCRLNTELRK